MKFVNFRAKAVAAESVTVPTTGKVFGGQSVQVGANEIVATGNTDAYVVVPQDGRLISVDYSSTGALAVDATNRVAFTITNLGQAGSGSAAMLDTGAVNSTHSTGGSAITANTRRSLVLHGTAGNLVVEAGDRLRIRATVSGTISAVAEPVYVLRFAG